jgi:hypothetical protein
VEVSHLIDRLLRQDPVTRPGSARRVVEELAAVAKMLAGAADDTTQQLDTGPQHVRPLRRGRRWRLLAAGGAGLAVVAALVGWAIGPERRGPTSPPTLGVAEPEPANRPPLPEGPPDDIWCRSIAQLPAQQQFNQVARKLAQQNPGYNIVTTSGWVEPEAVIRFADHSDFLRDIGPLRCLAELKTVVLTGSAPGKGKLTDLAPLRGLRLYWLGVARNPDLRDLGPVRGMPLFRLDLTDTGVHSLADVADSRLEELLIARTPVTHLGPVRSLSRLHLLDCTGCPIDSLEPLTGIPLQEVALDFRPDRDAAVLKRLTSLRRINGMSVKDFWQKQRTLP